MPISDTNTISFLTLSLQEVGSIIGKKGEIVNRFREEVSIAKKKETTHFTLYLSNRL